jgi:hypothetical protein
MKDVTSISRDAVNLLLQVVEHPRMMIGAGTLMDDFRRQASELMESGCLIPAGNQAVASIADDDDASFHELVWDSERKQHKYFTAESGWVFISADSMKRYVVDSDHVMKLLQRYLDIPANQRFTCLNDGALWHLGPARFGNHRVHIYFARRLHDSDIRLDFSQKMKREIGKTPAIIICAGANEPVGLDLPIDQVLISLHKLQARDSDLFSFDKDVIQSLLIGAPNTTETSGGIGLRFTTDYRIVHWNGEQYNLTKKQSAVVECLHNEGGRAHKDVLRAEARTNEELHRIMRNKVNGKWVTHPLWNTLIKSDGNGYYRLNT